MSPCTVFQAPATLTEEMGREGRTERHRLLDRETAQSVEQNVPGTATQEQASTILNLQYHASSTDRKYQLLIVDNFVKLHLTGILGDMPSLVYTLSI